jgi:hypothetical protein
MPHLVLIILAVNMKNPAEAGLYRRRSILDRLDGNDVGTKMLQ